MKAAMLAVTPESTPSGVDMPANYQHVNGFSKFASNPQQRSFTVIVARTQTTERVQATGTTGRGRYFLRINVLTKHFKRGAEDWDFEGFLAQENRIVLDFVVNRFLSGDTGVTGFANMKDEGVTIDDNPESSEITSIYTFRLDYRDSIAYP